jgi:NAD(P)-dependent dehydrogenase (short-subunit alcohol dehydrogenase family)
MASRSLEGRSVIVTGGGTGIGAACARRAAAEGALVTICGRTESRLQDSADRIRNEGGRVHVVVADVTVEEDVARLMGAAADFGGGLYGVVANAGGGGGLGPYHLQDMQEFVRVLHLNVVGTMLCIKHAVPHLARASGGSFVGMSSIAGHVTHPLFGAYPAAKAGIESMIRNAADEYGYLNLRFNAVQPGFIATELMQFVTPGGDVWNSYVDQTPLGDVGQPEDVANVVHFLLSDESRWMTGQALAVDGGHSLRRGPDFSSLVAQMYDPTVLDPTTAGG